MKRLLTLAFALAPLACSSPAAPRPVQPEPTAPAPAPPPQPQGAQAPVAAQRPHQLASPNGTRNDPYYWLRDDTRKDTAVLDYLAAENVYAKAVLAPAAELESTLLGDLRPDLYRGVVALVPFVDVVTTMLDESIPLTTNEFDEWGNPKEKAAYEYMLSYSPYDNVKPRAYPSIYVRTGLWDSQVQYYEPAKWVAKLQATTTDRNPIVLDTDMAAGHGGKSGRFDRLRDVARYTAFVLYVDSRPDLRYSK
jgi:protease II